MYCMVCLAAARTVDDDVRAAVTVFDADALCLQHFLDALDQVSPTEAEDESPPENPLALPRLEMTDEEWEAYAESVGIDPDAR